MRRRSRSQGVLHRFFRRGDVTEAFKYARWAPAAAFLAVYLGGGDTTYLTCAAAFAGWPTFRLLQNT
jgi:hypothetical protein